MNMICCTLKHLQCSSKTVQMEKKTLTVCYLHPVSDLQTLLGHYCHLGFFDHGFHKRGSITWTWCSCRLILPFMMTSPAVYGLCTLSICSLLVYFSLYHLNQWLFALPTGFRISSQIWLINLLVTLIELQLPCCINCVHGAQPTQCRLFGCSRDFFFPKTPIKDCSHSLLLCFSQVFFITFIVFSSPACFSSASRACILN